MRLSVLRARSALHTEARCRVRRQHGRSIHELFLLRRRREVERSYHSHHLLGVQCRGPQVLGSGRRLRCGRLTRPQTEQVLEDLRLQRRQLEKDIGKHSFLYGFMGVTALTALLWGWFGWARTIISPTMTPAGDDIVAVILLGT